MVTITTRSSARQRLAARLVSAVVLVLAMIALSLAVAHGQVARFDQGIITTLRAPNHGSVGLLAQGVSRLGSAPVWDLLLVFVAVACWLKGWRTQATILVVGIGTTEVLSAILKLIVDRPRLPGADATDFLSLAGFPSGHAVRTTVGVGLLLGLSAARRPVWWLAVVIGIAFVILVGWARIASGAHYPTDVVGGYLLAAFILNLLPAVRLLCAIDGSPFAANRLPRENGQATLDLHGPAERWQVRQPIADGLGPGVHRVQMRVLAGRAGIDAIVADRESPQQQLYWKLTGGAIGALMLVVTAIRRRQSTVGSRRPDA